MCMNTTYYKFVHLSTNFDYSTLPANLRMTALNNYTIDKIDFEMFCLAVGVVKGCEKCINAHEKILREKNVTTQEIKTIARIASIIIAISGIYTNLK